MSTRSSSPTRSSHAPRYDDHKDRDGRQSFRSDRALNREYSSKDIRDPRDSFRDRRDDSRRDDRREHNRDRRDDDRRDRRDDDRRDRRDGRDDHDGGRPPHRNPHNEDRYRRDEHQDKVHFPGDQYYDHFMALTKFPSGIKKGNLYFPEKSEQYKQFTYDHLHRPNRPRVLSGWDIQGTDEDQLRVEKYFASNTHAGTRGGASRQEPVSSLTSLNSSQDMELAIALLPSKIRQVLNLTADHRATDLVNLAFEKLNMDPAIDPVPITLNTINISSSNRDQSTLSTTTTTSTSSSLNQIPIDSSTVLTPQQLHQLFNSAAQSITTSDGKILRPKVYVSGFPTTGISQDRLKEQLATIIYQNLFQLEGRVPPRDVISPYTQQTAIRAIHCHPTFFFVEFTTLADGAAALSLNGLPVTLTMDDGQEAKVVLQISRPKDLTEYYTRHPAQHFTHPVIQEYHEKEASKSQQSTDVNANANANAGMFKVYIGNIDQTVSESDLRALFDSIPNLTAFNIPRPNQSQATTQQKVYGFATYSTYEAADRAVAAFHSKQLGARPLVVKHTIPAGATEDANAASSYFPSSNPTLPLLSSGSVVGGTRIPFVVSELPTEFIAMYNIADLEEFQAEKDDIIQDIIEGPASSITKILAVRYRAAEQPTPQSGDINTDVCIFLQCEDQLKASQVLNALHGKQFGTKAIQVKFIDTNVWNSFSAQSWTSPF